MSKSDDENEARFKPGIIMAGLSQDNIFYIAFALAELLAALILILVWVLVNNHLGGFSLETPEQTFNYHPMLMLVGMIVLNGNGILMYRVTRSWRLKPQKLAHAAIQMLAILSSLVGLWAVFHFHNMKDIPNMYSLHSWLGVAAFGGMAIGWPVAFVTFLWPGLSPVTRRLVLPFHIFGGNFGFVLSAAVAISGITEKAIFSLSYKDLPPGAKLANVIGILLVLFTALVLWMNSKPEFKRKYIPGVNETQFPMRREASID